MWEFYQDQMRKGMWDIVQLKFCLKYSRLPMQVGFPWIIHCCERLSVTSHPSTRVDTIEKLWLVLCYVVINGGRNICQFYNVHSSEQWRHNQINKIDLCYHLAGIHLLLTLTLFILVIYCCIQLPSPPKKTLCNLKQQQSLILLTNLPFRPDSAPCGITWGSSMGAEGSVSTMTHHTAS